MTVTQGAPETTSTGNALWSAVVASAEVRPDAVAVIDGDQQVTYRELVAKASTLARRLPAGRAEPLTAVSLPLSIDLVVAMLGALRAGGYVPVDHSAPQSYRTAVTRFADAEITRTSSPGSGLPRVDVDQSTPAAGSEPAGVHPRQTAYVLHTSGSTGIPKGVAVEHGTLLAHLRIFGERFGLTHTDRCLLFAPISTDVSIEQTLAPLLHGATLVIRPADAVEDPAGFLEFLARQRISVVNLPAGYWRLISSLPITVDLPDLRLMIVGSDVMPVETARAWLASRPGKLVNAYGPTEAVITAATHTVGARLVSTTGSVPIGQPLPGRDMRILDGDLTEVAPGETGELYLSGGLARGYLRDPRRTAEVFVPDPWRPGTRMYRTGDLARSGSDGTAEFAGRADRQVKIRGFRVEPAAVEAVARKHTGVLDCAATVVNRGGQASLVLVVVPAKPDLDSAGLLDLLRDELPAAAVPSRIHLVAELPLTDRGKLDVAAISGLADEPPPATQATDNLTDGLLLAWRSAFSDQTIGLDDDFVLLGGDSMTSLAIACQAPALGVRIRPRDIFEARTVRELAARLGTGEDTRGHSAAIDVSAVTPAVHWLVDRLGRIPRTWNQYVLLTAAHGTDAQHVQEAFRAVAGRHPVLSQRITIDGEISTAPGEGLLWTEERYDGSDPGLKKIIDRVAMEIDPEAGRMLRAAWLIGPDELARLLVVAHHTVVDAVSWQLLLYDLDNTYRLLHDGWGMPAVDATDGAGQWAADLRAAVSAGRLDDEITYWSQIAREANALQPAVSAGREGAARTKTVRVRIDDSSETVVPLSQQLLTAALLAWGRHSGRERCLVELEGTGRTDVDDLVPGATPEQAVGWLTAMYPAVLPSADRDQTSAAVARHAELLPHGGLGYSVLRYLHADDALRDALRVPAPDLAVNFLGRTPALPQSTLLAGDIKAGPLRGADVVRPSPIMVEATLDGDTLAISVEFDGDYPHADAFVDTLQEELQLSSTLRSAEFPLTPAQEGILFHAVRDRSNAEYVAQFAVEITGPLSVPAFAAAWQAVGKASPPLRTSFHWRARPEPMQRVDPYALLPVTAQDWQDRREPIAELAQVLLAEQRVAFDLERPPLFTIGLATLAEDRHICVITHHHLILDGWSMNLVLADFAAAYTMIRSGGRPMLKPRPSVESTVRRAMPPHDGFWREHLGGVRVTPLITHDKSRSGIHRETTVELPEMEWARFVSSARTAGLTPAGLVHLAWGMVLAITSDSDEVTFGTVLSGRDGDMPGANDISGMLINTLPCRLSLAADEPFGSCAVKGMEALLAIQERQRSSLVAVRRAAGLNPREALFDHVLDFGTERTMLGTLAEQTVAGLRVRPLESVERTNYGVTVTACARDSLELSINHDDGLLTGDEALALLNRMRNAIRIASAAHMNTPLGVMLAAVREGG